MLTWGWVQHPGGAMPQVREVVGRSVGDARIVEDVLADRLDERARCSDGPLRIVVSPVQGLIPRNVNSLGIELRQHLAVWRHDQAAVFGLQVVDRRSKGVPEVVASLLIARKQLLDEAPILRQVAAGSKEGGQRAKQGGVLAHLASEHPILSFVAEASSGPGHQTVLEALDLLQLTQSRKVFRLTGKRR